MSMIDLPGLPGATVIGQEQAKQGYANWRGGVDMSPLPAHWDRLPQSTRDMLTAVAAYVLTIK